MKYAITWTVASKIEVNVDRWNFDDTFKMDLLPGFDYQLWAVTGNA